MMKTHTTAAPSRRHRFGGLLQIVLGVLLVQLGLYSELLAWEAGERIDIQKLPDSWKMPASAINSRQIPQFSLHAETANDSPLPVYRLGPDSYFLFGSIGTLDEHNRGWNGNAGFVVTDAGVLVIDSLGTPKLGRRLIASIRSITDKPIRYLVITHNHPDHAYGASAFSQLDGVTLIAHRGTVDYNHSASLQSSVDYRQQLLAEDMRGFEPVEADVYIDGPRFSRKRITLGGVHFDIYNTGTHHSYGDLVVHQPKQNILWISDLAFNQRTTFMGDGDSAQILEAQDWLRRTFKDVKLMVPGHGSAQTAPFSMLEKTHDYVTRMRETMKTAVENGVSMYDAVQNVEFDDWKNVPLYEQNQRANANFVYREMEKAFFENF